MNKYIIIIYALLVGAVVATISPIFSSKVNNTSKEKSMKKILAKSPKHGNRYILVDDDDYEELNKYNWHLLFGKKCNSVYASTSIYIGNYKTVGIRMHRLIMNCPEDMVVDHRNHNGLDNQKCNLRICTRSQNQWNMKKSKNKKHSKYKGVSFFKPYSKFKRAWKSYIECNKIQHHLGYFRNEIEAAKAYNRAAVKYHGEFAYLNEV